METTLPPKAAEASDSYVNRRSGELLKRYRGTRARRQEMAEHLLEASQYELMLVKFRKHKLAVVSFYLLVALYLIAIFANFVAPYDPLTRFDKLLFASPTQIHIRDAAANFHLPFVYARTSKLDEKTFTYKFVEDTTQIFPLRLFAKGEPYMLWGLIPADVHLIGTDSQQPLLLMGSDQLGRDLFSRIVFGSRVSLFIGLVGVFISFF